MHKKFLVVATILGALSVALGAFAAHSLKQIIPASAVTTFETGVRYQFYHVFALLALGITYRRYPGNRMRYAGNCFIIGIILFSGSLYLLALIESTDSVGLSKLGLLTPIGGAFLVAGWLLFCMGILKRRVPKTTP